MTELAIATPHGPARAHVRPADDPRGLLVLGHGAGGGVAARDLVKAAVVGHEEGFTVALVEQPYRVAGRKSPAPAAQLDAAWTAVLERLRHDLVPGGDAASRAGGDAAHGAGGDASRAGGDAAHGAGGDPASRAGADAASRASGDRASRAGGHAAAFPVITGGRSAGARVACRTAAATGADAVLCLAFPVHPPGRPEKSRLAELDAVTVPVLVVQGVSDPFGMPPAGPGRTVVEVKGNHSLGGDMPAVGAAIRDWLGLRL